MRSGFIGITMMIMMFVAGSAAALPVKSETRRIADAARVIKELRLPQDNGIPDSIWNRARCVAVVPSVKKVESVFGEFGRGVVRCRTHGGWSRPVFLTLEKRSFGAPMGEESIDLVLLVMNEHGIDRMLQNKMTLGMDASLASGPVGRTGTAGTHGQPTAEMLSYFRAGDLVAGIDLSGGVLRTDNEANWHFYGHAVAGRDLLLDKARERSLEVLILLFGAFAFVDGALILALGREVHND